MATIIDVGHHIKALLPALKSLQALGYSAEHALAGTGISEAELASPALERTFTLNQEFRFHRNLLQLTGDPLLGLHLGKSYSVGTYGLLGYAFMSAPTLRHAMTVIRNYGPLSFTLFRVQFQVKGATATLSFSGGADIPADLLTYYIDRDLTAAAFGGEQALQESLQLSAVRLMHSGGGQQQAYREHFGCPVLFDSASSGLEFDAALLDLPMPLRDPHTSTLCQQQCQLLLAGMSQSGGFAEQVRQLIIARPGYFPDVDYVAERLKMTSRTLRRRLSQEGSSYQKLLDEVRYELAQEYLRTSTLPLEEISILLGYSAPGNFSNAFKRWHGSSPRQYRQENR